MRRKKESEVEHGRRRSKIRLDDLNRTERLVFRQTDESTRTKKKKKNKKIIHVLFNLEIPT